MDLIDLLRPGAPPIPPRWIAKLSVFWRFTCDLASLSRCQRLQVGCVIVRPDLSEVAAIGYNGPPTRVDNDACRGEVGACGCIHADANALVKLRAVESGLLMILTHSPCEHCAGLILNCGRIGGVVYGCPYRDQVGRELLEGGGLAVATVVQLGLTKIGRRC